MEPNDDWMWLDGRTSVDRAELARICRIAEAEIEELVDYGCLRRGDGNAFRAELVAPLREAMRLRAVFDLDLFTVGLLLQYLQRIEQLERQVRRLPGNAHEREGPASWREPHA